MNITIIGGAGYLGNSLSRHLLEIGHKITVLDTFWFSDGLPDDINKIRGDLRNKDDVNKALEGADICILVAAIVGPDICAYLDPEIVMDINFTYIPRISEICKKRNIKLIYTSTASVYGFDENRFLDESSTDINAVSLYGKSKYYAEKYITESNLDATVFRLGTLMGLSVGRMRYDLVVNLFTAQALNNQILTVHGGEQWRPMVHINDVCRGIQFAIENDIKGLYNLMYANYNIKLIAEIIASKLNAEFTVDPTKSDTRSTFAKNIKLKIKGFHPQYSVLDAIKSIVSDPTESWKNYKDPKYHNMMFLKKMYDEGKLI